MRSSNRPVSTLLAFLGAVVGGCAAPVVDDDITSATSYTTEAIVLVERTAADGQLVQTNVSAKFMRLGSNADLDVAERVVGGSWLDLPTIGECRPLTTFAGTDEAPALSDLGSIELLDVGDLSITAESTSMPLATRAFPDVGGLVSGVFYTSRDARSDLPAPGRYVLESTGSGMLERFSIGADAPANPEGVRIGNVDLAEGVMLEEGTSTNLTWLVAETASESRESDLVYVDLTAPSGTGIRCTYKDLGQAVIPAAVTTSKAWEALPAVVSISLHRIRQGQFAAPGIDDAELRFDFSVVGKATIVPSSL
ncbi:MAG: hypothetical protein IPM54_10675 [Polyangiaceae bacterium]|nr:hypothetical protein [Polyangiaceae bacterium]